MFSTFWAEAVLTAVYLVNKLPTKVLQNSSPFYKLFGNQPEYNSLRVFGCVCYPWLRPYTSNKLEARSKLYIFIGYCSVSKGHRCYDQSTGRVKLVAMFCSRKIYFHSINR